MILYKPLDWLIVTQPFSVNYLDWYKQWGLLGHNGVDLRADISTPTYAEMDGKITFSGFDEGGGNMVIIQGDAKDKDGAQFETRKMHLSELKVKQGNKVKAGDVVALTGNTGKYTTGEHLHIDLKRVIISKNGPREILDYDNGYKGCIDPAPYIQPRVGYCEWLRVDDKYGRMFSYTAEFIMRFKNPWLHKYLIKIGRKPDSLTQREMTALVYGGWDVDSVFNPAMYPNWSMLKKDEYLNKIKPAIRVIM